MVGKYEDEMVLPTQYHTRGPGAVSGEHRLMAAVFEEAMLNYLKHVRGEKGGSPKLYAAAAAWFASNDRAWPFAFLNVCDALNFEPEVIRCGLYAHRDRQPTRVAPERSAPVARPSGLPDDWLTEVRNRVLALGRPVSTRDLAREFYGVTDAVNERRIAALHRALEQLALRGEVLRLGGGKGGVRRWAARAWAA